jgi:uncharacterized membrane protein
MRMTVLILGLVLFLGVHLVPALPRLRAALAGRLGEKAYKGGFSVLALLGLVLIVVGYARAPAEPRLFAPFVGAHALAPALMIVSFILLAAANMKTHIRRSLRHPMLIGVGLWAAPAGQWRTACHPPVRRLPRLRHRRSGIRPAA